MNIVIIISCMVLLGIVGSLVSTVAGLTGLQLAPLKELSTLPNSMISAFTAIGSIPAAAIAARYRRRPVLVAGGLLGIAAMLQMSWAVSIGSFSLFLAGTATLGLASAAALLYRFYAASMAERKNVGHVHSASLAAGLVASLIGPYVAVRSSDLYSHQYVGSYLTGSLFFACATALIFCVRFQEPEPDVEPKRIAEEQQGSDGRIYVWSAAVINAMMSSMMMAAPLMAHSNHLALHHVGSIMQAHYVSMCLPGMFAGFLTSRWTPITTMTCGVTIGLVAALVALLNTHYTGLLVSLSLCGISWGIVSVSTATAVSHLADPRLEGRYNVWGAFGLAFGSLSAGGLVSWIGQSGVAVAELLMLGVLATSIALSGKRLRRRATA